MTPKIKSRLNELNKALIEQSNEGFTLSEKGEEQISCRVKLAVPAILLKNLDKWEFKLFNKMRCADYAIIKKEENGYSLHLFELKKTIKPTDMVKIMQQFTGAFLRAEMIAKFLNIHLYKYYTYIIYLKEKNKTTNPIDYRNAISNRQNREDINSWGKDSVNIYCFDTSIKCYNYKIILKQNSKESIDEVIL
ncbi:MAG: hypothetical protein LBV23_11590 [Deltaproteobacteria bacterium]|jgi:hypothetical protein|nr:hypothetical protein [Deltaproteobacteria bacterium]